MDFIYRSNQIALYDTEEKLIAEVTFPDVDDNTVNIDHTFVDDSLRGQGVAGKLMEAAAKELRTRNKKADLTCTYATSWFAKHPEYKDVVK
ncbi:MAG: GNAT family N-acetyltransferase [Lachnospiraceae bacterium]